MKMNAKSIKVIAGVALIGSAFAFSGGSVSSKVEPVKAKSGAKTPETVGLLAMTHPTDEKHYKEGTYVFEGQIGRGKKVEVLFDDRDPVRMDADSDGAYRFEAPKVKAGDHKIEVKVTDAKNKGAKPESEVLEFEVKAGAQKSSSGKEIITKAPAKDEHPTAKVSDDELPTDLLPEDDGSDVVYSKGSDLGVDDVAKKDTVVEDEAHGKPAKPTATKGGATAKPAGKPVKPAGKPVKPVGKPVAKNPAGKFVISSHSNFNVVPHGIIKVGGKGNPGEKIMLLVDGKPSMRGTVKPNGRWSFPVKVSKAGFRKITAQNLKTRQLVWVKLKIK